MADRNGSDAATELEGSLLRARSLAVLAAWVEGARQMLDSVHFVKSHDEAFASRLHEHDPHWGRAEWHSAESEGLQQLATAIEEASRNAHAALESMLAKEGCRA